MAPKTDPPELYLETAHGERAHRYGKRGADDSEASWGCSMGALVKLRQSPDSEKGVVFILVIEPTQALPGRGVIRKNRTDRMASDGDVSFKLLSYTRCRR